MCTFVLAFPQRKLLIAECKNTQVTKAGWNLKSFESNINLEKKKKSIFPHMAFYSNIGVCANRL